MFANNAQCPLKPLAIPVKMDIDRHIKDQVVKSIHILKKLSLVGIIYRGDSPSWVIRSKFDRRNSNIKYLLVQNQANYISNYQID